MAEKQQYELQESEKDIKVMEKMSFNDLVNAFQMHLHFHFEFHDA